MYYLLSWPDDDEAAASSSRLPRDEKNNNICYVEKRDLRLQSS